MSPEEKAVENRVARSPSPDRRQGPLSRLLGRKKPESTRTDFRDPSASVQEERVTSPGVEHPEERTPDALPEGTAPAVEIQQGAASNKKLGATQWLENIGDLDVDVIEQLVESPHQDDAPGGTPGNVGDDRRGC